MYYTLTWPPLICFNINSMLMWGLKSNSSICFMFIIATVINHLILNCLSEPETGHVWLLLAQIKVTSVLFLPWMWATLLGSGSWCTEKKRGGGGGGLHLCRWKLSVPVNTWALRVNEMILFTCESCQQNVGLPLPKGNGFHVLRSERWVIMVWAVKNVLFMSDWGFRALPRNGFAFYLTLSLHTNHCTKAW